MTREFRSQAFTCLIITKLVAYLTVNWRSISFKTEYNTLTELNLNKINVFVQVVEKERETLVITRQERASDLDSLQVDKLITHTWNGYCVRLWGNAHGDACDDNSHHERLPFDAFPSPSRTAGRNTGSHTCTYLLIYLLMRKTTGRKCMWCL